MFAVETPFPKFDDLVGAPLQSGYVYFGAANDNPRTAPVDVFWDVDGTQPAAQPLRTINGVLMRAGSPANVYCATDYSIEVLDAKGQRVVYEPSGGSSSNILRLTMDLASSDAGKGAGMVKYLLRDAATADPEWLDDKLANIVSVTDFGGDAALSDNAAAIQDALNYAALVREQAATVFGMTTALVELPAGIWQISTTINVPSGVHFKGRGAASILEPMFTGTAVKLGDGVNFGANVRLTDMVIRGNYTGTLNTVATDWTTATDVGILLQKLVRNWSVERVVVMACTTSIKAVGCFGGGVRDSYLTWSKLHHFWSDNSSVSFWDNVRADWCENVFVGVSGGNAGGSIFIDGSVNDPVGFHARGGTVQICFGTGILLYDVDMSTVDDIHFEANYHSAIIDPVSGLPQRLHADIDIVRGPNSRGLMFKVGKGCFFSPGSSPAIQSYTAVRCNQAAVLDTSNRTLRDSHYWRGVDVLSNSPAVAKVIDLGSSATGAATRIAYDPTITDVVIDEQDGAGVMTVSRARVGGLRLMGIATASNFPTDGRRNVVEFDTSAGSKIFTLRDVDFNGFTFPLIVCKKTREAVNSITVQVEAGSTKRINGATSVTSSGIDACIVIFAKNTDYLQIINL